MIPSQCSLNLSLNYMGRLGFIHGGSPQHSADIFRNKMRLLKKNSQLIICWLTIQQKRVTHFEGQEVLGNCGRSRDQRCPNVVRRPSGVKCRHPVILPLVH